jgi:hypothetical protein
MWQTLKQPCLFWVYLVGPYWMREVLGFDLKARIKKMIRKPRVEIHQL